MPSNKGGILERKRSWVKYYITVRCISTVINQVLEKSTTNKCLKILLEEEHDSQAWWHMPTILAHRRYRQEEQEFMVILNYTASSKSEWSTKDPVSNKTWGGGWTLNIMQAI